MCAEAAINLDDFPKTDDIDPVMKEILKPLHKHYKDENTVELRIVEYGSVITDRRGEGKRKPSTQI